VLFYFMWVPAFADNFDAHFSHAAPLKARCLFTYLGPHFFEAPLDIMEGLRGKPGCLGNA